MKKILLFLFLVLFSIVGVSAIDYDNITFTNEEFLGSGVTDTKVLELSNGRLVVGYVVSGSLRFKICDIDGTNCGSENTFSSNTASDGLEIIDIPDLEQFIIIQGATTTGQYQSFNYSGSGIAFNIFNPSASTNYVSAVQTNSSHFAIAYQDTADSNKGKLILCKLDGSSCGSEILLTSAKTEWNKIIKTSSDKLAIATETGDINLNLLYRNLDGSSFDANNIDSGGNFLYIDMIEGTDNKLKIIYTDGTNSNFGTFRSCDLDGTNCGSEIVYFSSSGATYNNLVEINEKLFIQYRGGVGSLGGRSINMNLTGGEISNESIFNTNTSNHFSSVYTTQENLLISYGDSTSSKGLFAISEPLLTGDIITNLTNNQIYPNPNISVSLNSSGVSTNMSYSINSGSFIDVCTNCNYTVESINFGLDGEKNVSFKSNVSGEIFYTNLTIYIDTTNPTINNSIPAEINSYFFESNQFSCSDTNLDICNITINNQTLNTTQNTTLTLNGNLSYTIFAEDLAGNTANESGFLFVDPFVYFLFENSITNNSISDYTVDGFQVNGTEYKRKYFDIFTNSTQTFTFSKNGYVTTDFNVDMLNNETINETFNIDPVNLFVRVYDGETLSRIDFNLTIENGNITSYQNLNVFNQSFPNIPLGDIKLTINSENYSQAVYFTTIQTNTSTTFDVYLTPEDLTTVITYNVRDFSTNNLLGNVLIEARRIINDSRVTVQQTKTDSNGLAYLYLDGLKDYEFVFSRDGYVSSTIDSIPGVTTYTVKLVSDSTTFSYIDDISYRFSPNTATIYGGNNVTFKAFISSSSLTQSRLVIRDDLGNILFNETSTNPLGTQFEFTKEFLNTTNISKITMTLSYIINGFNKQVSKEYSVFSISDSGVEDFILFGEDGSEESRLWRFFIIITTFATFIILGGRNQTTRDFVSLITLIPLFIFTFVGWIPYLYATVMTLILIVLFMGGNKR